MKRKLLATLLSVAMATTLLAGCGSGSTEAPAAAQKQQIQHLQKLLQLTGKFRRSHGCSGMTLTQQKTLSLRDMQM